MNLLDGWQKLGDHSKMCSCVTATADATPYIEPPFHLFNELCKSSLNHLSACRSVLFHHCKLLPQSWTYCSFTTSLKFSQWNIRRLVKQWCLRYFFFCSGPWHIHWKKWCWIYSISFHPVFSQNKIIWIQIHFYIWIQMIAFCATILWNKM